MDLTHPAFSREGNCDLGILRSLHQIEQRTKLKLAINSTFDFSPFCSQGHFTLVQKLDTRTVNRTSFVHLAMSLLITELYSFLLNNSRHYLVKSWLYFLVQAIPLGGFSYVRLHVKGELVTDEIKITNQLVQRQGDYSG